MARWVPSGGRQVNETEEQQRCKYCHGDSELIMDDGDYGGIDVYISGNILTIDYINETSINYCPMCGRKLV